MQFCHQPFQLNFVQSNFTFDMTFSLGSTRYDDISMLVVKVVEIEAFSLTLTLGVRGQVRGDDFSIIQSFGEWAVRRGLVQGGGKKDLRPSDESIGQFLTLGIF